MNALSETPSTTPNDLVAGDTQCRSCGYNLRTQPVHGTCPECGEAVMGTLRHDLQFADKAWIKTVRRGAMLYGWGQLSAAIIAALCWLIQIGFGNVAMAGVSDVIWFGPAVLMVFATFAVTKTEPGSEAYWPRWRARLARIAPFAFTVAIAMNYALANRTPFWLTFLLSGLWMATFLLWPLLVAGHARWLAVRGQRPRLVTFATAVMCIGAAWFVLQMFALSWTWFFPRMPTTRPPTTMSTIFDIMGVLMIVLPYAFVVLLWWLMRLLCRTLDQAIAAGEGWRADEESVAHREDSAG